MKLSAYRFDLPSELIALYPAENRDDARLMVVHRDTGKIEHRTFRDIVDYFEEGDLMVVNNTKVFPARLYGYKEKTGADIEVFLLRELKKESHLWDAMVDPARKIRVGNKLFFGDGELVGEVIDNTTNRGRTIRFLWDGEEEEFYATVKRLGNPPLPEPIYSRRKAEPIDEERFQTIFAEVEGAIAPPAAGLHFTKQVVKRLAIKGVDIKPITMHISLGSFRDVEVEDLTKHRTDSEQYAIPEETAEAVNQALEAKRRVCAVDISTLRTLETSVSASNRLKASEGWTDKFIFPRYDFKIANALLVNFELPEATALMSACAFGGYDLIMEAYQEAIKEGYRFFIYGDAMLIL
ncbi:tRNA preQ1(34) S-adenosylmethionine ribosyltransferase-isomerase QueA [Thermonema rossianum]|uniref:tRNA preQ1(34) S-adenosylmethionine ribosyltransferase-isomerase QueA n=1 Tax=Thermonema rossianum TaxID=55505 RepID=UPI0005706B93|nr:tRNA preQ1(34) S-adenosylmethionine ribosyltransferase-isomerase QueA [Thermonema rossianum]